MATVNFIIGDTIEELVTIYEPDGVTLIGDLTNGTVKFRIVSDLEDAEGDAVYVDNALTLSDPTNSIATLSIARSVTKDWTAGQYWWEVEYIDSGGNYSHTYSDICKIVGSIYSADS